jgi:hypothetical protein
MARNTNVLWGRTGGLTRKERDAELRDALRTLRHTLAAKRRDWVDDEIIDVAGDEEVEAAARLLAGARCGWGDAFREDDCVPIGEWEPGLCGPSPGMLLLMALGLVARCDEDEYGNALYTLCYV